MSLRRVAAAAARIALAPVLAAGAVALAAGSAQASGLKNQHVAGFQYAVSCLSSQLCVLAGYNNASTGDVVPVRHGTVGRPSAVGHTQQIYSVSCPGASGCVALSRPNNDIGALFVSISRSGVPTRSRLVKVPPGVTLTQISCTSLRSCEVAGTDIFVSQHTIEVGSWNGSRLTLHRVNGPKGTDDTIGAVSCSGTSCAVAGYAEKLAKIQGIIVTTSHGKPTGLHTFAGEALYGVSCVSKTRCYASGNGQHGGVVLTVNRGVPGSPSRVKPDLFGIACKGNSCTAAGEQLAPPPSTAFYWGAIVSVSSGKVTSTQLAPASGGYNGVARVGSVFTAVGTAQHGGSEVTTG
jgi:hypothetical protein